MNINLSKQNSKTNNGMQRYENMAREYIRSRLSANEFEATFTAEAKWGTQDQNHSILKPAISKDNPYIGISRTGSSVSDAKNEVMIGREFEGVGAQVKFGTTSIEPSVTMGSNDDGNGEINQNGIKAELPLNKVASINGSYISTPDGHMQSVGVGVGLGGSIGKANLKAELNASLSKPYRAVEDLSYYFRFMIENGCDEKAATELLDKTIRASSFGAKIDETAQIIMQSCVTKATEKMPKFAVSGNTPKEIYENAVKKGINGHINVSFDRKANFPTESIFNDWEKCPDMLKSLLDKGVYGINKVTTSTAKAIRSFFGLKNEKSDMWSVDEYGAAQIFMIADKNIKGSLDPEFLKQYRQNNLVSRQKNLQTQQPNLQDKEPNQDSGIKPM